MQNPYTKKTVSYQDVMVAYLLYALKQRIQTDWHEWRVRKPRLPEHWLELKELPQEFFEQLAVDITNDKAVKNYKNASVSSDTLKRLVGKKAQNKGVYVASLHAICLYLWQIDWFDFIAWLEVLTKLHQPLPTALPAPAESAAHTVALQLYHFVNPTQAHDSINGVSLVLLRQTVENKALALRQAHQQYIRNEQTRQGAFFSIAFFVPLVFLGWFWFNLPKTHHIYTEEECKKIVFKILKQDIGETQASYTLYYDLGDMLITDTLIVATETEHETAPKKMFKKKDTVNILCYKPSNMLCLKTKHSSQVLAQVTTNMKTNAWIGYTDGNKEWYSGLQFENALVKNGVMAFDSNILTAKQFDYFYTVYSMFRNFDTDIDHISVEMSVKSPKKIPNATCMGYGFQLYSAYTRAMISMDTKGCSYWVCFNLGQNTYYTGGHKDEYTISLGKKIKYNEIKNSNFTLPDSIRENWHILKMTLKDNKAYYYVNDRLLHEPIPYTGKIGKLEGMIVSFKGAGAVDWIRIRDRKGREVYFEDFNDPKNMAKPKKFED